MGLFVFWKNTYLICACCYNHLLKIRKATSFKLGSDKKEKFSNKSSQQRMLCCFLNYMIQQIPWCFRCRIGMALESSRRQITVADPQNFGTSLC